MSPQEPEISQYTVGWICALQEEYEAACEMRDAEFDGPQHSNPHDDNTYAFGRISGHNVVIGCLPSGIYGISSATHVAKDMVRSFPKLRFALMVGIGGGIPSSKHDIRLGDVVVSEPRGTFGGVVRLDLVKRHRLPDGGLKLERMGQLQSPPRVLLGVLPEVKRRYNHPKEPDRISENIGRMCDWDEYQRPAQDRLFRADYHHQGGQGCDKCADSGLVSRPERKTRREVVIHYGNIGTSDSLMKNVDERTMYAEDPDLQLLCFEMEAGGIMNTYPCLVIRGICDYSDSHKNDVWHKYAALAAAAYARELLVVLKPENVARETPWAEAMQKILDIKLAPVIKDLRDNLASRICAWIISDLDFQWHTDTFTKYYRQRYEDTGSWLLDHPEFLAWLQGRHRALLCHGAPGVGKSVATSIVITHLRSLKASGKLPVCAYLYCSYTRRNNNKQTPEILLCTLLRQLCEQLGVSEMVKKHFGSPDKPGTPMTLSTISAALVDIVLPHDNVYLVVDALDECSVESRDDFLKEIDKLQQETEVHVLATSRTGSFLGYKVFRTQPKLQIKAADKDIQAYIRGEIKNHFELIEEDSDLYQTIPERIAEAAGEIFLLAGFLLKNLRDAGTRADIRASLAKLPRGSVGLQEIFDNTMDRISSLTPVRREWAEYIISWIFYCRQPLTEKELQHALAVKSGDTELNVENLIDLGTAIAWCEGLVTLNRENNVVQFSHSTVQEYFERKPDKGKGFLGRDRLADVAARCITYLSFTDRSEGPCGSTRDLAQRRKLLPFFTYAAENWGHHAREAEIEDTSLVLELLEDETKASAAAQMMRTFQKDTLRPILGQWIAKGVHLASYFGLPAAMNTLLDHGYSSTFPDICDRSPLALAVENGWESVVRVLLDHGVDVNKHPPIRTKYSQTALHLAVQLGNQNIIQLLLDNNAEVNTKTWIGGRTALHIAVAKGDEGVVKLLLAYGANVNDIQHDGLDALNIASSMKSESMEQVLIGHIIRFSTHWDRNMKFHSAVIFGRDKVVASLLDVIGTRSDLHECIAKSIAQADKKTVQAFFDHCPEVDITEEDLYTASRLGDAGLVELLLQHKTPSGFSNQEALGCAIAGFLSLGGQGKEAELQYVALVKLLLRRGADRNTTPRHQKLHIEERDILYEVARKNCCELTRVLLQQWPQSKPPARSSILEAVEIAAGCQNVEIVRIFFECRHSLSIPDDKLTSMDLYLAAANNDQLKAQSILNDSVRIGSKDIIQFSIHQPALQGYADMVRLLLQKGVHVDVKDQFQETALHLAVRGGNGETVCLLLDAGADVNVLNESNESSLYIASEMGRKTIVKLLLEKGADVSHHVPTTTRKGASFDGGTALHRAASHGYDEIIGHLLDHSAPIHATTDKGGLTVLMAAIQNLQESSATKLLEGGADPDYGKRCPFFPEIENIPLHWAAAEGHSQIVRLLLDYQASVHIENDLGEIALDLAAENGHGAVVAMLIEAGAAVNRDISRTLCVAISRGHEGVAALLLTKGKADLNLRFNYRHQTALHLATIKAMHALVGLLLDHGADVNTTDSEDATALHRAALAESVELARLLLDHNAEVNKQTKSGWTALHLSANNSDEVISALLLKHHAQVNSQTAEGRTALHIASDMGHTDLVRSLLGSGADATRQDNKKSTALHFAASAGSTPVIRSLLHEPLISVNARDCNGMTPLHNAARSGHKSICELLIAFSADVNITDAHGRIPRELAMEEGHGKVAQILLSASDLTVRC